MTDLAKFSDYFLGAKGQDSLAGILSFLTCHDLGRVAITCQRLATTVKGHEGNVNVIWEGAQLNLTKTSKHDFCNAREHCRFFVTASKYATSYEAAEEEPPNRMTADEVKTNFFSNRGYDKETIAKLVKSGKEDTRPFKEAVAKRTWTRVPEANRAERLAEESRKREEMMRGEKPKKEYHHHELFIRISRVETKEIIGQGFCRYDQLAMWLTPHGSYKLELSLGGTILGFEESPEYQSFLDSFCSKRASFTRGELLQSNFHFTVMAIDKRNPDSAQCIFRSGDDSYGDDGSNSRQNLLGYLTPCNLFQYSLNPKWDSLGCLLLSRRYLILGVGTYVQSLPQGDGVPLSVLVMNIQMGRLGLREETDALTFKLGALADRITALRDAASM